MFILLAFLLLTAFIGSSVIGVPPGGPSGNVKGRSFSYYDLQKQVGDMGDDFRQLLTNLIGATQVVYWKNPTNRIASAPPLNRRVGMKPPKHADRHQAASGKRKKKALHSDYDDLIAMDTWSFFR